MLLYFDTRLDLLLSYKFFRIEYTLIKPHLTLKKWVQCGLSCGLEIIGGKNSRKKGIKIVISNSSIQSKKISSIIFAFLESRLFFISFVVIVNRSAIIEKAFVKCHTTRYVVYVVLLYTKKATPFVISKPGDELWEEE